MGSREPLLVEVSTHDSHAVMRLIGELDLSTAPLVLEGARDLVGVKSLLDLSGLTFMDAVGLSTVLQVVRACGRVRVIRGPPQVHRVFEITSTKERLDWVT
jgi:anti-anti-sigma factor